MSVSDWIGVGLFFVALVFGALVAIVAVIEIANALARRRREQHGMSEREVADRLRVQRDVLAVTQNGYHEGRIVEH